MVTILDGDARVLRGTIWSKLVEGAHVPEADLIDVTDRVRVRVEWADGATLSINGPATVYAANVVPRDSWQSDWVDLYLNSGWMKIATQPSGPRLRVRLPDAAVNAADVVAVVHGQADAFECFVERGTAKPTDTGRSCNEGPGGAIKAGPICKSFMQRLRPSLSDTAFRVAAAANFQAYPDWSSLLFPTLVADAARAKSPPPAETGNDSRPPQGGPRKQ